MEFPIYVHMSFSHVKGLEAMGLVMVQPSQEYKWNYPSKSSQYPEYRTKLMPMAIFFGS